MNDSSYQRGVMFRLDRIREYAELVDIDFFDRPADEVVVEILTDLECITDTKLQRLKNENEELLDELLNNKENLKKLLGRDKRRIGCDGSSFYCEGPVVYDCESCEEYDYCSDYLFVPDPGLPHYILHNFMAFMSPQAFKLLVYLFYIYPRNGESPMVKSLSEISDITGIPPHRVSCYLEELRLFDLIEYDIPPRSYSDSPVRECEYSLPWYDRHQRLKSKLDPIEICTSCP